MLLKGQVAVVTGASVGIGRAISEAYGREGASVVINYRSRSDEAERTAQMVRDAGGKPHVVQADVSTDEGGRKLIKEAVEKFGTVHILVNNAGITSYVPFHDLEGLKESDWNDIIATNVKGPFYCSRAAIPHMKEHGKGAIINIASQSGIRPQGSSLPYSLSKAAVIHMTKCLAVTFAPEVRTNCISPGFIDETKWNEGRQGLEELKERTVEATPLKSLGVPSNIADAALYLASPAADYTNGAILAVDGGRTL